MTELEAREVFRGLGDDCMRDMVLVAGHIEGMRDQEQANCLFAAVVANFGSAFALMYSTKKQSEIDDALAHTLKLVKMFVKGQRGAQC